MAGNPPVVTAAMPITDAYAPTYRSAEAPPQQQPDQTYRPTTPTPPPVLPPGTLLRAKEVAWPDMLTMREMSSPSTPESAVASDGGGGRMIMSQEFLPIYQMTEV